MPTPWHPRSWPAPFQKFSSTFALFSNSKINLLMGFLFILMQRVMAWSFGFPFPNTFWSRFIITDPINLLDSLHTQVAAKCEFFKKQKWRKRFGALSWTLGPRSRPSVWARGRLSPASLPPPSSPPLRSLLFLVLIGNAITKMSSLILISRSTVHLCEMQVGYRHIDCAQAYGNEKEVFNFKFNSYSLIFLPFLCLIYLF